jgi:hypothetical protein
MLCGAQRRQPVLWVSLTRSILRGKRVRQIERTVPVADAYQGCHSPTSGLLAHYRKLAHDLHWGVLACWGLPAGSGSSPVSPTACSSDLHLSVLLAQKSPVDRKQAGQTQVGRTLGGRSQACRRRVDLLEGTSVVLVEEPLVYDRPLGRLEYWLARSLATY